MIAWWWLIFAFIGGYVFAIICLLFGGEQFQKEPDADDYIDPDKPTPNK